MVVLDGLQFKTAVSSMGYMNHLVEKSKSSFYKVQSELPSLSRPLYEVLLTGTPCYANGITSNQTVRLSKEESIFHLAVNKGYTTASASYYWVSELYNRAPFNIYEDREQHDERMPIQHGKFYFDDAYPNSHLFADAEYLRKTFNPDFLYIHPMGIDDAGHKFGSDSKEYRTMVLQADDILSLLMPSWIEMGYEIIVTSDHGMNVDGSHGGTGSDEREVPLFIISNRIEPKIYDEIVPQLSIAPLVCRLLNIEPSSQMRTIAVPGFMEI